MGKLYKLSLALCIFSWTASFTTTNAKQPQLSAAPVCATNGSIFILFRHQFSFEEFKRLNKDNNNGKVFRKTLLELCRPQCDFACINIYEPLCALGANDAKRDFYNQCEMARDACLKRTNWVFLHDGLCSSVHLHEDTSTESEPNTSPRQAVPCRKVYNPVCAIFNGVKSTFMNECLVNEENLKRNLDWKVISNDICDEDNYSGRVRRSLVADNFDNIEAELGPDVAIIHADSGFQSYFIGHSEQPIKRFYRSDPTFPWTQPAFQHTDPFFNHKAKDFIRQDYSAHVNDIAYPSFDEFDWNGMPIPAPYPTQFYPLSHPKTPTTYEPLSSTPIVEQASINDNEALYHFENLNQHLFKQAPRPFEKRVDHSQLIKQKATTPLPITRLINLSPTRENERIRKAAAKICRYGTQPVCASFDGRSRTFKDHCELMLHKELSGQNWARQHNGKCKECQFDCNTYYNPICVARNGRNFTLINECFLKKAMCEDKHSDWRVISKGVCGTATNVNNRENASLFLPKTIATMIQHQIKSNRLHSEVTTALASSRRRGKSKGARKRRNRSKSRREGSLNRAARNFRKLKPIISSTTNATIPIGQL